MRNNFGNGSTLQVTVAALSEPQALLAAQAAKKSRKTAQ
jgi:hypothetical protein